MDKRITLHWDEDPGGDINQEIQWICRSIGLFPIRDYNSSQYRIFIELIKDRKSEKVSTSDELARKVNLSRATIIHHLKKMIRRGIVSQTKNGYTLEAQTLSKVVSSLRSEVDTLFDDLSHVARTIDERLDTKSS
jgi:predicted transcriptional regulator